MFLLKHKQCQNWVGLNDPCTFLYVEASRCSGAHRDLGTKSSCVVITICNCDSTLNLPVMETKANATNKTPHRTPVFRLAPEIFCSKILLLSKIEKKTHVFSGFHGTREVESIDTLELCNVLLITNVAVTLVVSWLCKFSFTLNFVKLKLNCINNVSL